MQFDLTDPGTGLTYYSTGLKNTIQVQRGSLRKSNRTVAMDQKLTYIKKESYTVLMKKIPKYAKKQKKNKAIFYNNCGALDAIATWSTTTTRT